MAAETLCVLGESGHGKSSSLRNLNPDETFIIATVPKPLPFKGWKKKYTPVKITKEGITGNYYVSSNWEQILKILQIINNRMPHIKNVICDD